MEVCPFSFRSQCVPFSLGDDNIPFALSFLDSSSIGGGARLPPVRIVSGADGESDGFAQPA